MLAKDEHLALEEKHGTLLSEHRKLRLKNEDLLTRYERLGITHEELKEQYHKADERVRVLETLQEGDQEGYIKDLKSRLQESELLIANQERQLEDFQISRDKQDRELISIRPYALRVRELGDECNILKSENDTLLKKANMVDHFQRKLESLNMIERENASLREYIDTLQENLKDFDQVHLDNEKLRNTLPEYEKKFSDYELEVNNLSNLSNIYKDASRAKDVEIETLKARQASDERFIQELQESMRTGINAPFSPNSPAGRQSNLTLEDELAGAPDPTPNYLLELSRLQAENQLLKSGSSGTTNATLRIDLEESERKGKRLSETIRGLTEDLALKERQLAAVLEKSPNEKYVAAGVDVALKLVPFKLLTKEFCRDQVIARTRDMERKATEELKFMKAKLQDAESQLNSKTRDLLAAKADCKLSFRWYVSSSN